MLVEISEIGGFIKNETIPNEKDDTTINFERNGQIS